MMNKLLINEYEIKYGKNNILNPCISKTFENRINNTKDMNEIAEMIINNYKTEELTEEHSFVVAYSGDIILGIYLLSKGTDLSCLVSTRMLFRFLLLIGANAFVLLHNHPNGDINASKADLDITKKIEEAANLMDITFINHIIIGKKKYNGIKNTKKNKDIYFN